MPCRNRVNLAYFELKVSGAHTTKWVFNWILAILFYGNGNSTATDTLAKSRRFNNAQIIFYKKCCEM